MTSPGHHQMDPTTGLYHHFILRPTNPPEILRGVRICRNRVDQAPSSGSACRPGHDLGPTTCPNRSRVIWLR
ncbi:unnamed protein product [Protopolystoma xenopodis]|uniref:Uncharacterized protein n=1 Tax=Protopolystoma xenopodis TaxID=117903 RepID=A0A3S5CI04_9PLAT|nr:unnamed protein product [Protopolystoma xenopodis]